MGLQRVSFMLKNHKALLEITLLAALFAPSFLFIKIAVQELSPITFIAIRVGLAGLLLYFILKLRGVSIPKNYELWKHCFILGIFVNGPPFVCFSYALTHISTSLSALINGLTPVLTVFLANIFLNDERLTLQRIVAVILGLSGFLILFVPTLIKNAISYDTLGILLCFIGAAMYAVGAVYARKFLPKSAPLVAPTLQLLTSLIYLVPFALIFENPLEIKEASLNTWAAVFGVSVIGTMLAFIMYHRIVNQYGATIVAMSTFMLPIFGTLLGVIFLKETITMNFLLAATMILSGVGVINGLIPLPRIARVTAHSN